MVKLFGHVEEADFEKAIRSLFKHPAWEPSYNACWDCRGIARLSLGPKAASRLITLFTTLQRERQACRSAVLIREGQDLLLAKKFFIHSRTSEREMRIFTSTVETALWLKLPPNLVESL